MCSGTVINSWSVLTAAHCFDNNKEVSDMVVQVGARYTYDHDAEVLQVSEFVIHTNYGKARPFACDIAIIFVDNLIEFGPKVKKALLAYKSNWMGKEEKTFQVAGWGWTKYGGPVSDRGLMITHLQFVPKKKCERLHQMNLTADMFCLYGDGIRDSCKGDSGGGVLWEDMIVGIVSHGNGCSKKDKPSIYTNVWYFRDWIESRVQRFVKSFCRKEKDITNRML
ncbi:unnamed protein product, partial [Iphiclides podalirius]